MKKFLKIAGLAVGLIIVLMLILPFVFKDKIVVLVKNEANKMLNARLEFEELDLSFFRHFPKASIGLKNFSLSGIDEFEGDTLVSARRVSAAVDVMSLFGNEGFDIHYITVDRPSVKALKLKDGRVNWDIVKPDTAAVVRQEEDTVTSDFALKLKKLSITDGVLTYRDDSAGMTASMRDFNLTLAGDMSAADTRLDCRLRVQDVYFRQNQVTLLNKAELEADVRLDADMQHNKFTFSKNEFRLNAIRLNVDGWVMLPPDGMDMDIRVNSPSVGFKDILSLIPAVYRNNFDKLQTSGTLTLDAWAKGKLAGEDYPAFGATLSVKNGMVDYDLPEAVREIEIQASADNPGGSLNNTRVEISKLSFTFAGNPFRATFSATTPLTDLNFRATADGRIDLNKVKDFYPLGDSVRLSGLLTADLNFAGRMSDIEKERYQNIRGEGVFAIKGMTLDMPDLPAVSVEEISASVSPEALTLKQLAVKVGLSDIEAKGQMSNYLPYLLKNETLKGNLQVSSRLLDLNELMGGETASGESDAVADTTALEVFEVPGNLDLMLTVQLKKVIFQQMNIDDFSGKLQVSDGTVRMAPVSFGLFGGRIDASGSYSTALRKDAPDVRFNLAVRNASFEKTFRELDMIRKLVPLFEKTGGTYSLSLDMQTLLDAHMNPDLQSLKAKGVLQSNNIQVQNIGVFDQLATLLKDDRLKKIEAKDLKISFTIEDGKIITSPFNIRMGNISLNLAGTTGLDQQIDYTADISLPENSLGGYVQQVKATIGGTFTKPEIHLNTGEMAKDAVNKLLTDKMLERAGTSSSASKEEQIAAIRRQAEEDGQKLVEAARREGGKLEEKAKNPVAKLAARKAAETLVKEAQKQADRMKEEAEKKVKEIENQ